MADWENLTWNLPLGAPPVVAAAGRNAHGFVPSDRYRLPDLWSLHVYGYDADCRVDGVELPIRPGYVGLTPPGALLETRYRGISVHLYVHFQAQGELRAIRAMQALDEGYDAFYERIHSLQTFVDEPSRSSARLWDALWELASRSSAAQGTVEVHPAVLGAVELIERRLAEDLSVVQIAETVGISTGYLVRLFREAYDETVVGYRTRRRIERATHLLQRSTLPIKAIAASVGIGDLQRFNKAIRAHHGVGPREVRGRYGLLLGHR